MSTIHDANIYYVAQRRSQEGGGGGFIKLQVDQLQAVKDYNKNMNRVDPSDQSTGKYDTLRKTKAEETTRHVC